MQMIILKKKLVWFLLLPCLFCFLINNNVLASETEYNDVVRTAFDNSVPQIEEDFTVSKVEVIFDSRYNTHSVLESKSTPTSYDYYKTYRTGVTCKGSGAASSYLLNANITFYVNVFFKSSKVVGYEKPVVTKVYGVYGATGYSKPSVKVASWSAHKMKFKGTCKLTAGGTYTMKGTKSISLP